MGVRGLDLKIAAELQLYCRFTARACQPQKAAAAAGGLRRGCSRSVAEACSKQPRASKSP